MKKTTTKQVQKRFKKIDSKLWQLFIFYSSSFLFSIFAKSTSKINTEFFGIFPTALFPYAKSEGIMSFLISPTHIPNRPISHPFMTSPLPKTFISTH